MEAKKVAQSAHRVYAADEREKVEVDPVFRTSG
jgi:hypothetical protein